MLARAGPLLQRLLHEICKSAEQDIPLLLHQSGPLPAQVVEVAMRGLIAYTAASFKVFDVLLMHGSGTAGTERQPVEFPRLTPSAVLGSSRPRRFVTRDLLPHTRTTVRV